MESPAIILSHYGGPEQLILAAHDVPEPKPGELLIRHTAVNVNFHDIYVRTGLYKTLALPGVPGLDAVGVVEATGPGEIRFKPGDRIGWISAAYGGYSARRILPSDLAFPIPDGMDDAQAAASIMKGFTARMLVNESHRVKAGQTVLIHAAAGGVGQLLCQWCKALGARVLATVGSEAKAEVARACGADEIIFYREDDFVARVSKLTDGQGVAAVFDSVGKDTFAGSLKCLDYTGTLVNFGQSSGAVAPFTPSELAARSLTVTRPILFHFLRTREALDRYAGETLDAFTDGTMRLIQPERFPLSAAADAHRLLESGKSPGGIVLIPE